ncbi:hypothetical protein Tco_1352143 [Tanacetum coccineum]
MAQENHSSEDEREETCPMAAGSPKAHRNHLPQVDSWNVNITNNEVALKSSTIYVPYTYHKKYISEAIWYTGSYFFAAVCQKNTVYSGLSVSTVQRLSEDIQSAGSDTRPPMLDRSDFESWKQRLKRDRVFADLTPEEKERYKADIRAMNILLQGSELTKDERESRLYDEFEHFPTNTIFVTVVKLNRGLKTSYYDQLYAYLKEHEAHDNKNEIMLERYNQHAIDPLAFVHKKLIKMQVQKKILMQVILHKKLNLLKTTLYCQYGLLILQQSRAQSKRRTRANDVAEALRRICQEITYFFFKQELLAIKIPALEEIYDNPTDGIFTNSSYDDEGAVADFTNLEPVVNVSPIPTSRINSIHPSTLILGDPQLAVQTRSKVTKSSRAYILLYLKGKPKLGLWYPRVSSFDLEAYSDSDYARANLDRKSTTGGCQFIGRRLISWQCKKQTIVATSTTEAEYVATNGYRRCSKVWRTRDVVNEKKESAEEAVSTEVQGKRYVTVSPYEGALSLNMSQAKAVSREKEKGVELKDVEETERRRPTSTRSLLTLKPLPKIDLKDKGKKKIEEEDESDTESEGIPEAEKKFNQLARDEEMARKVQEDWEAKEEVKKLAEEEAIKTALSNEYDFIQARIEADRLLALRLQNEKRERFTVEERAKFLHDTIAAQRRFLVEQRAIAIRITS